MMKVSILVHDTITKEIRHVSLIWGLYIKYTRTDKEIKVAVNVLLDIRLSKIKEKLYKWK